MSPVRSVPADQVRVALDLPVLAGAVREDHVLREPGDGATIRRSRLRSEQALAVLQDVELPPGQAFPPDASEAFIAGLLEGEPGGAIAAGATFASVSDGVPVSGRTFRILADDMSCLALQRFADPQAGGRRRSIFLLFCEKRDVPLAHAEVEQVVNGLRVR
jgi:hypothetical protein